jgi:hypothetical protein
VLWRLRLIDRVCCIRLECEAQPVSTVTQGWADMNAQQVPQLHTSLFRCKDTTRWSMLLDRCGTLDSCHGSI